MNRFRSILTKQIVAEQEWCGICHQYKPCYHSIISKAQKQRDAAMFTCIALIFCIAVLAISCALLSSEVDVLRHSKERIERACFSGVA
jgi:hypothetical protein